MYSSASVGVSLTEIRLPSALFIQHHVKCAEIEPLYERLYRRKVLGLEPGCCPGASQQHANVCEMRMYVKYMYAVSRRSQFDRVLHKPPPCCVRLHARVRNKRCSSKMLERDECLVRRCGLRAPRCHLSHYYGITYSRGPCLVPECTQKFVEMHDDH